MKDISILLFYPHNFFELSSGTHKRIYDLMQYFKSRRISVDLLSISGFTNRWTDEELARKDLFNSARTCSWEPTIGEQLANKTRWGQGALPNHAIGKLRDTFRQMARKKKYDFIFVSYVYWADLIDEVSDYGKSIVDLHDFITLNLYLSTGKGKFRYGKMFQDEINAISKFDFAFSISEEEMRFLSPFCPETDFVHLPMFYPPDFRYPENGEYEFDIFFIGSDNPFNKEGIQWFMNEVYPLLSPDIAIGVAGKICNFVEKRDNIQLLYRIDDLSDAYFRSKIAFCPLKAGTGLKVKTVESLSFGRPVATTSAGLDGICQKAGNGCYLADEPGSFANAIERLVYEDETHRQYCKEAREFFRSHFSEDICYKTLDGIFFGPNL